MAALPERRRTEWLWREGRNEMIQPDEYLQGAEVYEVQVSVVIVTLVCTGGWTTENHKRRGKRMFVCVCV